MGSSGRILVLISALLGAASCVAACGGSSSGSDAGAGGAGGSGAGAGGAAGTSGSGGSAGTGLIPGDTDCEVPSDCTLVLNGCCAPCGLPSSADVVAVRKDRADEISQRVCAEPVPCPKCASFENPALIATCQASRCTTIDLRKHPVTECSQDVECRLRSNACCECGGPTDPGHLLAVGKAGGIESLICDPDFACDECLPQYPADAVAICDEGHCTASYYVE